MATEEDSVVEVARVNMGQHFEGFRVTPQSRGQRNPIVSTTTSRRGTLQFQLGTTEEDLVVFASDIGTDEANDLLPPVTFQENRGSPIVEMRHVFGKEMIKLAHSFLNIFSEFEARFYELFPENPLERKSAKTYYTKEDGYAALKPELLRCSRQYREAVKHCVLAMEKVVDSDAFPPQVSPDEYIDQLEFFKVASAVWHLAEIFLIDDGQVIAPDMVNWIQENLMDTEPEEELSSANFHGQQAVEANEAFWKLVKKMIIRGQTNEAWDLLSQHSLIRRASSGSALSPLEEAQLETYDKIRALLLSLPSFSSNDGRSLSQFSEEWSRWRRRCGGLLSEDRVVRSDLRLQQIMRILTGQEEALRENSSSWYELMVADLLYCSPLRKRFDYRSLMVDSIHAHGGNVNAIDITLMNVMEGESVAAMRGLHSLGIHLITSHLADLLLKAGKLPSEPISALGCDLRQYFFLDYARELGALAGGYQLASEYLWQCGKQGRERLRCLVEREEPTSDRKANKLLQICDRNGFETEALSILQARSMWWKRRGRPGASLLWLLRGRWSAQLIEKADKMLQEYIDEGDLKDLNDIVDALAAANNDFDPIEYCSGDRTSGGGHDPAKRAPNYGEPLSKLSFLTDYRNFLLAMEDVEQLTQRIKQKGGSSQSPDSVDSQRVDEGLRQGKHTKNSCSAAESEVRKDASALLSLRRQAQEAAAILALRLLRFHREPQHFWRCLLDNVSPLLDVQPPLFSSADTFFLLDRQSRVFSAHNSEPLLRRARRTLERARERKPGHRPHSADLSQKNTSQDRRGAIHEDSDDWGLRVAQDLEEDEDRLQLQLVRGLSRAIIEENAALA